MGSGTVGKWANFNQKLIFSDDVHSRINDFKLFHEILEFKMMPILMSSKALNYIKKVTLVENF